MVKNETIKKRSGGTHSLLDAAKSGDDKKVQKLLQMEGIDVNVQDETGWTPLHMSASLGHDKCVAVLLTSPDIKVNARENFYEQTPLHCAAFKGREACIRLLLAVPEIEVNAADIIRLTPLHNAAAIGHTECVDLLLAAPGVNVNATDIIERTPLHWAAMTGKEACVDRLLAAPGVEVNAVTNDGNTPLHIASAYGYTPTDGHTACVTRLLKTPGVDVNAVNHDGQTPYDVAKIPEIREAIKPKKAISSSGGKPNAKTNITKDCVTYAGKKYMVRMGSNGGKYILVGAEKKKVYIRS